MPGQSLGSGGLLISSKDVNFMSSSVSEELEEFKRKKQSTGQFAGVENNINP